MSSIIGSFILIKWIKTLIKEHQKRKQQKRIDYGEKQWDKKLKGLR